MQTSQIWWKVGVPVTVWSLNFPLNDKASWLSMPKGNFCSWKNTQKQQVYIRDVPLDMGKSLNMGHIFIIINNETVAMVFSLGLEYQVTDGFVMLLKPNPVHNNSSLYVDAA